jgi:hypothetical protein
MSPAPQPVAGRLSAAQLRDLFQQFVLVIATDTRIAGQFAAWSDARRQWRSDWIRQAVLSPQEQLQLLIPSPAPSRQDRWVHPAVEEAPELDAWRRRLAGAAHAERDQLAAAFVTAVARIERDPAFIADACAELSRAAGGLGCPLAAFTAALNALDPLRFVTVSEATLGTLVRFEGGHIPSDIASCAEVNARAFRWLAAAEGDSSAPATAAFPPADRFGVFCQWVLRASADAGHGRDFDVSRKKYKDWPPMW